MNVFSRRPEDFCSAPERNLLNERPSLESLAVRLNLGVMESLTCTQEYTFPLICPLSLMGGRKSGGNLIGRDLMGWEGRDHINA